MRGQAGAYTVVRRARVDVGARRGHEAVGIRRIEANQLVENNCGERALDQTRQRRERIADVSDDRRAARQRVSDPAIDPVEDFG